MRMRIEIEIMRRTQGGDYLFVGILCFYCVRYIWLAAAMQSA